MPNGHQIEDRVVNALKALGCQLLQSSELDHIYKLDCVILSFDGVGKMRPCGLQITTRPNNRDKIGEFLRKQRRFGFVEKALYVEILNYSIEGGVDRILYAAILNFLFSSDFANAPFLGLRIHPGFSFEFFDLSSTKLSSDLASLAKGH